jgi:hypothetical protein
VSERLRRARRGVRGGAARPPLGGCRGAEPPARGFGGSTPEIFFLGRHIFAGFGPTYFAGPTYFRDDIFPGPHDIRWFSAHGFLPMVFYFRLRN